MWMNVLIVGILAIFVLWTSSQGFFSAILQFASTVVAGALAFAVWEPLYYLVMPALDSPFWYDVGWGILLILSFALFRGLLQMLTDKACIANVFFTDNVNWIGSGAMGLCTGIVTAGMLLIGVQYIHGPTRILAYQGWNMDTDATIIREDKLWVPVDDIVEFIYSTGSNGAMYSTNPLSEWQPRLAQQASLFRTSYGDGASRMGMRPEGIKANRVFRVSPNDAESYLTDLSGVTNPQTGQKMRSGQIYAINLELNNATADKGGQIRLSKGQISLIVQMPDGEFLPVYPHAFYGKYDPASRAEFRFYFDVGDDFATSVGVGAEISMAFEFAVPDGATIHHIQVRNARSVLASLQIEEIDESDLMDLARNGNVSPGQ